jgi:hypothetical protein
MLTVVDIQNKLQSDQRWLERGILAIDARQTEDERRQDTTKYANGRGWSGADARKGSYYARWIRSGRHLSGRHLYQAKVMMRKYARQLLIVAEEKQQATPTLTATATVRPQLALPAPAEA